MKHEDAVLCHMIGQVMDGGAGKPIVTVADVAKWKKCTRQNASAKLLTMLDRGIVRRVAEHWRPGVPKYRYELTPEYYRNYKSGLYRSHYIADIADCYVPW